MARYLTEHPTHVRFLDFARTNVGFEVEFFTMKPDAVDPAVGSAAMKAKFAIHDAIGRVSRLAGDESKTLAMRHEGGRIVMDNLSKEVSKHVQTIRDWSEREAEAAGARALAVLNPDPTKAQVYSEIRAYCASRRSDPEFPAELAELCRTDLDTARAVANAPGYLSGVNSTERHMRLKDEAVVAFAPDDVAHMRHAVAVGKEADRMQEGMKKLHATAYTKAVADRIRSTHVDTAAPFAEPPAAAAE